MEPRRVVGREAWIAERRTLLEAEKSLTEAREALAEQRRSLPWVRLESDYVFASERGTRSLATLFGRHDQLVVQHFMFGADWRQGCPSCSFWSDNFQGALPHLAARGVAFVAVSEAPVERLLAYRERMGWRHEWVSSAGTGFGHDFHVTYTPEEVARGETFYNFRAGQSYGEHSPGISVFAKDARGAVYHTYSAYARGLDALWGMYQWLDRAPHGRNETGVWQRRRDEYDKG